MTKFQMGYFQCIAFWRCFCVSVVVVGFSCCASATFADSPNFYDHKKVRVPKGLLDYEFIPTYYANGLPVIDAGWGFDPLTGTPPCGVASHKTSLGNSYEHLHRHGFPIFRINGQEITKAMIAQAWIRYYENEVYGYFYTLSVDQPDPTYNCHSFSTNTTSHWSQLRDTKLPDDFKTVTFHYSATFFGVDYVSDYGTWGHSIKVESYGPGPSGTGIFKYDRKEW